MSTIVITKENCPNCVTTKMSLKEKGISFKEIKAREDTMPSIKSLAAMLGVRSFPIVIEDTVDDYHSLLTDLIAASSLESNPSLSSF